MSVELKSRVDEVYKFIEERDFDKAEALADLIDEITLQRNTDTVRARILIKRGRKRNAQD